MKRVALMPLDAARQTYKVGDKALQATVFGDTWRGLTCETVWAVLRSPKIPSPCKTDNFLQVRLLMKLLPDDMGPLLI